MKTLFALVGLPFSGKSTLLKYISEKTDIKPISFDVIWKNLESNIEEGERNKLTYEYVTSLIDIEIEKYLREGSSVAYDSLNDTPDQRMRLKEIAVNNDAEFKIIYLDTSRETIERRRKVNDLTKDRHLVNDDLFINSIQKFIPPTIEECDEMFVFKEGDDLTQWVSLKFKEWI
jgi:predicted kinase